MKLKYKIIDQKMNDSFLARREAVPCLEDNWHFHKEYELIYFMKSSGIRYIGNTIRSFRKGEVYLIGSNLPHLFKNVNHNDGVKDNGSVDMVIIQFSEDIFGKQFLNLFECRELTAMLRKSQMGLRFTIDVSSKLHSSFIEVVNSKGLTRMNYLLTILDNLSLSKESGSICTDYVSESYRKSEKERMAKVLNYLSENYSDSKISLARVAEIANMTPNAFCRFFKKKTQNTLSDYLNRIRIGNACKFLIEGEKQISEISYITGFNSLSNFNKQFKLIKKMTPSEYIKKHLEVLG